MNYWLILFAAGLCEIAWAVGLKASDGFSKPVTTLVTVVLMVLSFVLLAQSLKGLPLGTAYAVWTGIGAVGTAIYGMAALGEPRNPARVLCIVAIVLGIAGLKLFESPGPAVPDRAGALPAGGQAITLPDAPNPENRHD